MRYLLLAALGILAACCSPALGFGYIFSRFRPEANPWGYYGGNAEDPRGPAQRLVSPREQLMEALLEEENLAADTCDGRQCSANEHCCSGHVCVNVDGIYGTCLSSLGQTEGAVCRSDSDCDGGLLCDAGTCAVPSGKKLYNEPCGMSSECDIERGLCCQVVRRHRQAPKKLCGYFKDPMICIGHVAVNQIQRSVEHTKGEKRLTGKGNSFVNIK